MIISNLSNGLRVLNEEKNASSQETQLLKKKSLIFEKLIDKRQMPHFGKDSECIGCIPRSLILLYIPGNSFVFWWWVKVQSFKKMFKKAVSCTIDTHSSALVIAQKQNKDASKKVAPEETECSHKQLRLPESLVSCFDFACAACHMGSINSKVFF